MKTIRIFISSPGDVKEERKLAKQAVLDLQGRYGDRARLVPVLWEELGIPATDSFQVGIDFFLTAREQIDVAVFIIWSRLGSPLGSTITRPDGSPYLSGTEREFELMDSIFKQSGGNAPVILAYTRKDDEGFGKALDAHKHDDDALEEILKQRRRARKFIEQNFKDEEGHNARAYHSYQSPKQFAESLSLHLRGVIDKLVQPYDVFISHSKSDKNIADSLCAVLERQHLKCWIAPRDILPGSDWGEAIVEAIGQCRSMIVIFSRSSNESTYVVREVERAVNRGIPIIPIRIEEVLPSRKLELYLSVPHWLDALTSPVETHFLGVAQTLHSILAGTTGIADADTPNTQSNTSPAAPNDTVSKRMGAQLGGLFMGVKQGMEAVKKSLPKSTNGPVMADHERTASAPDAFPPSSQVITAERLKGILEAREVAVTEWTRASTIPASPGLESLLGRAISCRDDLEGAFRMEDYPAVLKHSETLRSLVSEIMRIKRSRDEAESARSAYEKEQASARDTGAERFAPSSWDAAECFARNARMAYEEADFLIAKDHWKAAVTELRKSTESLSASGNRQFHAKFMQLERLESAAKRIRSDPHDLSTQTGNTGSAEALFREGRIEECSRLLNEAEEGFKAMIFKSADRRKQELRAYVLSIASLLKESKDIESDESRQKAGTLTLNAGLLPEDAPPLVNQAWKLLENPETDPLPNPLFWSVIGMDAGQISTPKVPIASIENDLNRLFMLISILVALASLPFMGAGSPAIVVVAIGMMFFVFSLSANMRRLEAFGDFKKVLRSASNYYSENPEKDQVAFPELVSMNFFREKSLSTCGVKFDDLVIHRSGGLYTMGFNSTSSIVALDMEVRYTEFS